VQFNFLIYITDVKEWESERQTTQKKHLNRFFDFIFPYVYWIHIFIPLISTDDVTQLVILPFSLLILWFSNFSSADYRLFSAQSSRNEWRLALCVYLHTFQSFSIFFSQMIWTSSISIPYPNMWMWMIEMRISFFSLFFYPSQHFICMKKWKEKKSFSLFFLTLLLPFLLVNWGKTTKDTVRSIEHI
jgi:hypothetical protein